MLGFFCVYTERFLKTSTHAIRYLLYCKPPLPLEVAHKKHDVISQEVGINLILGNML